MALTNEAADEARDRESARQSATRSPQGSIANWKPSVGYTFQRDTTNQDAHCRAAGLTGGVVDVVAAAIAAAVAVPGLTGPFGGADNRQQDAEFLFDASPLELRAWCMEFAPSLVDTTAPRMPGARWW